MNMIFRSVFGLVLVGLVSLWGIYVIIDSTIGAWARQETMERTAVWQSYCTGKGYTEDDCHYAQYNDRAKAAVIASK